MSERVREVQERRAREATQEVAETERDRFAHEAAAAAPAPQLEQLPQARTPAMNPLVAAALRRIERANRQIAAGSAGSRASGALAAAAIAYAPEDELESSPGDASAISAASSDVELKNTETKPTQTEKTHSLIVVPPPATTTANKAGPRTSAKRLISENDAALNYLDTVRTVLRVDEIKDRQAGMFPRIVSALVDLLVSALLFSPFAAVVELTSGDWQRFRTTVFAVGVALVVTFLYLTAATALTGRTLGMRLLAMRTVDRRTGLIPTGTQSAGRALVYLASLITLGLPIIYALLSREGCTPHDRLTNTVVVRD